MRKAIKETILSRKKSAAACAGFLLHQEGLDYSKFDSVFTSYLCDKFMLEREELTTDDFYTLCQMSAEKASHLPPGLLDASELASKCGGATTAMNKKVLFLLAVNRDLGIKITAEEGVRVDTFTQLKQLVYNKLIAKRNETEA